MKKIYFFAATIIILSIVMIACGNLGNKEDKKPFESASAPFIPTPTFNEYWYGGKAEITSYSLTQARYGELRKGDAVLIYVTEDFLPKEQVKADKQNPDNISVLKLNSTKNFNTGIYPYSIMQSSFYPVSDDRSALKVSGSVQEWCGQAYTQINARKMFEITTHSYFENEADKQEKIPPAILENELWNKIRIRPEQLPTGEQSIIPSVEYCRLMHKDAKAYKASALLVKDNETYTYTIFYPELDRDLSIKFNSSFPYEIMSWTETYKQGALKLSTVATKIKTIKTDYWTKNKNEFGFYRDSLGLKQY